MGEVGVEYLVHRLSTKIKYQSNKIEINDSFSKNGAVNQPERQAILIQCIWFSISHRSWIYEQCSAIQP